VFPHPAGPLNLCSQRYHPVIAPFNRRRQSLGPQVERGALFLLVGRAIVDAGDARLVAADVVQDGLDHVRLDTQIGYAGRRGATKIVDRPGCERRSGRGEPGVEPSLPMGPAAEPAACKHVVPVSAGRDDRCENGLRRFGKGTRCARRFFVLSAGNRIMSSRISSKRRPPISLARQPLKISNLTIEP
jgi:hypothetical protein